MWIHLLRHGIAIDRADPACPPDPQRYLTDKGHRRTRTACRGWGRTGVEIDLIAVSPYVRAQQTADHLVEALQLHDCRRVTIDALVPMGDPVGVVEALGEHRFVSVVCVGHAPNLDAVLAHLVGADRPVTALKKAGVATLETRTPGGGGSTLFALHPPALLRQLGAN